MAKKRTQEKRNEAASIPDPSYKIRESEPITIPTGDSRHIGKIREGKISGEVFCRDPDRRRDIGLPALPTPEPDYT